MSNALGDATRAIKAKKSCPVQQELATGRAARGLAVREEGPVQGSDVRPWRRSPRPGARARPGRPGCIGD